MGNLPFQEPRRAVIQRATRETNVEIELNLDGQGVYACDTGIGFLDHMLAQLAHHGLFDLKVLTRGDLVVDAHHSIEDTALALGDAFSQALGDRRGIIRMGSAYVPMDESLALVVVDFSGRPFAHFQAGWHTPLIGGFPTSLIEHFWQSFALNARCNLHLQVLYGRDDHHQAEAIFKAAARALEMATRIDPRRAGEVPSTKGTL